LWGPATGAAPPPPVNAASIATTAPANAATIAATAPASATTGWQPPPRAISGAGGSTSPPWSAGRAAGRAFLGVLLGGTLSEIYYAATDYYTSASDIAGDLGVFLVIAGIVAGIVVAVEKVVPALRIPGGRAYRLLGNNRWIVPVVVSLPLGILLALGTRDIVFLVLVAAGFLVAEAIVDRRGSTANATS